MLLKIAELFACCRMLQHNLPSEPLLQASFVVLRSSYGKLAPQSNNIPLAAIGSDIKMWYDVNCTTRDPVERCVSCAKMNQFARMLFAGSARSYTKWCKSYLRARRCFQDPTRENAHAMEISRFCTFGPFLQDVLLAAPALQFLDQMGQTTPKVLADQLCKAFGRNGLLVTEALIESDSYIFILYMSFSSSGGPNYEFSSHRAQMQKESRQASMVYGHLTCLAVLLIKRPPCFCRNAAFSKGVGMQERIQQGCN